MSDLSVSANRLSKQFRIGEWEAPYKTLRESLVSLTAAPFRMFRRGKRRARPQPETFWALKDVSFDVHAGEVIGIIGRNGAGKSTLLKILSRITEPTSGEAVIRGRVSSLLEVGIGFHGELTGRENLFLNGAILGMRKAEIDAKFDEIVAFAEVEKFIDTAVKHYSSGMYLRLAFAVAAHLEPEILIVDEVLAVGDANFQRKCLSKMEDVGQRGRTVLFVSHNMPAVDAALQARRPSRRRQGAAGRTRCAGRRRLPQHGSRHHGRPGVRPVRQAGRARGGARRSARPFGGGTGHRCPGHPTTRRCGDGVRSPATRLRPDAFLHLLQRGGDPGLPDVRRRSGIASSRPGKGPVREHGLDSRESSRRGHDVRRCGPRNGRASDPTVLRERRRGVSGGRQPRGRLRSWRIRREHRRSRPAAAALEHRVCGRVGGSCIGRKGWRKLALPTGCVGEPRMPALQHAIWSNSRVHAGPVEGSLSHAMVPDGGKPNRRCVCSGICPGSEPPCRGRGPASRRTGPSVEWSRLAHGRSTEPEWTQGIRTYRLFHRQVAVPGISYALSLGGALSAARRIASRGGFGRTSSTRMSTRPGSRGCCSVGFSACRSCSLSIRQFL